MPGALATVYFKVGAIVHATFGANKGPEALSLILQAAPESSEFRDNLTTPETTIRASLEALLASPPSPNTPAVNTPATNTPPGTVTGNRFGEVVPNNVIPSKVTPGEVVPDGFLGDLSKTLIEIMGPIGSVVLDDALADLHLPNSVPKKALPLLLEELSKQLKNPTRQQPFAQKSTLLLARYGLR